MEQPTTAILRRSSDAVVIIDLGDGTVVDVNEAFFTMTGHARHELVGRAGRHLLVGLAEEADPVAVEVLQDLGSLTDVPVGLWTRSGELRVGDLSALVLQSEGRRDALCTIREVRDPTPGERRSVAWTELDRILQNRSTSPEAATRALQAFGRCLRWEFGTLWRVDPRSENLRCAAIWRAPQPDLEQFQEGARYATFPPSGMKALRRVCLRGEPTWVADTEADPELSGAQARGEEAMHGWLGFPALRADGVIGVVQFASRETREPDAELLGMIQDFGHLFGRLLGDVEAPQLRRVDEGEAVQPETREPSPATLPAVLHDLAGAIAAATEALERHPTLPMHGQPTALLVELTAMIGRLNRLLEHAIERSADRPPASGSAAPSTKASVELPTGLTLKAVSRRTGIPAATLRTWEHRYGFMRPRRSAAGYRLYGEAEIARIEQVKYLVGQGVRVGAAMKAVMEEAGADEGGQLAHESRPGENEKHAEVYRLNPRSPRDRRS